MIQIIAGNKGEGKTKKLIEMANEASKVATGHVVFIDNDNRHMYDLHYDVRFVETSAYTFDNYKVFFGFLCGIQSQDSDIQKVYIDGISKILKNIDNEYLSRFLTLLDKFSTEYNVDFVLTLNGEKASFTPEIEKFFIEHVVQ